MNLLLENTMTRESTDVVVSSNTLISNYPLFCLLSADDISNLVLLAKEIPVDAGHCIVREGDIVDSFYLIKSGTAEVTKILQTVESNQTIHIAFLGPGDAIGLAESGFFSLTGIRKATVTSKSTMILLALDIKKFYKFLKNPGVNYPALKNLGEKVLLMQFLKESKLFQNLTTPELRQLAYNANRVVIKSGGVFFKEGDLADTCYFLLSGEVTVFTILENQKKIITELEAPNLFGEGAFFDKEKRNASAVAKTDCKILLINNNHIKKLIDNEHFLLDTLNLSRIEQLRPRPCGDILEQIQVSNESESLHFLRKSNEKQILISEQEYSIWKELDGISSLLQLNAKLPLLSIQNIYTFILKMHKANFVEIDEIKSFKPISGLRKLINQFINGIKKIGNK